jgi:hypothetical protein
MIRVSSYGGDIRKIGFVLLSALIILVPLRSLHCEETDEWKAYLEYYDPGMRLTFTCYYGRARVTKDGDFPITRVWEKLTPQEAYFGQWGCLKGRVLKDTTNLFEIDCTEKKVRIIETYSHYEGDLVSYSLIPSPWQAVSVGSREDQLVRVTCRSSPLTEPERAGTEPWAVRVE